MNLDDDDDSVFERALRADLPTLAEQKRFLAIRQVRDKKAAELQIDATLIASRSTMVLLSQDWDKYKTDLMRWQRELLENPAEKVQ